jgi:hypothetical protein
MSDNSAVPRVLLVDNRFHELNRQLKGFVKSGSSKSKWEEIRNELRDHINSFFYDEIDGSSIANFSEEDLPEGYLSDRSALYFTYSRSKRESPNNHGYQDFKAGRALKKYIVCWWCVNEWLQRSKQISDEDWDGRSNRRFLHVFGKQGQSQSSELTLNSQGYATHGIMNSDANGGSRCQGITGATLHPGDVVLALRRDKDRSWNHSYLNMVKNIPDEDFYRPIENQWTELKDHHLHPETLEPKATMTPKFKEYDGYIDRSTLKPHEMITLDRCLTNKTGQFRRESVVFLEGLSVCRDPIELIFKPHSFGRDHTFSYRDSIEPLGTGLGLFLFVKSRGDIEGDRFFTERRNPVLNAAISRGLDWTNTGQLFQISPESFEDAEETQNSLSSVDFSDWLRDSTVLRSLSNSYGVTRFPTIRTTLKSVSIFEITGLQSDSINIGNIKNGSRHSAHSTAYMFKLTGFRLGNTRGSIRLRSTDENDGGKEIIRWEKPLEMQHFAKGAVVLRLPEKMEFGTRLDLLLWVSDGIAQTVRLQFTPNASSRSRFRGFDQEKDGFGPELVEDDSDITAIFNSHLKLKLSQDFGYDNNFLIQHFFLNDRPLYTEIMKQKISDWGESFSLAGRGGESSRKYPGLDILSFGRENLEEVSLGRRLRATGIYRASEDAEKLRSDGESHVSGKWRSDGEYCVSLADGWNMLLTEKPLHRYGLRVDDERLVVTNHGIFFKDENQIDEFSHLPVEVIPRFIGHLADSPGCHLQFLIDLMDCTSQEHFNFHQQERFFASRFVTPTSNVPLLGTPNWNKPAHWTRISSPRLLVETPLSKFYLTHQFEEGILTCLDIVLAKNQGDNPEQILLLRRHHQDGMVQHLPLLRELHNGQRYVAHRPEWWHELETLEHGNQELLSGFHELLGGKYKTNNTTRAHDWFFLTRETLRAFHLLSGNFPQTETNTIERLRSAYSFHWPEPLRKFLMGGGKFNREEQRNADALGGLFDEVSAMRENPGLEKALIDSVLRWTWCLPA